MLDEHPFDVARKASIVTKGAMGFGFGIVSRLKVIRFLFSPGPYYMTGELVVVDGGRLLM